jgi:uncharacterized membrane protein
MSVHIYIVHTIVVIIMLVGVHSQTQLSVLSTIINIVFDCAQVLTL